MTSDPSLWARVGERYAAPVALKAGSLGARFEAVFEDGLLIIRKSNGVERRVDFDEFRATWRVLASGSSEEALRIITGNADYLRSIRDDLIARGVPGNAEVDGLADDDVSTMERQLLIEAERYSRPAGEAVPSPRTVGGRSDAEDQPAELEHLRQRLAIERELKESAAREIARLSAELATNENELKRERERATALERAATSGPKPRAATAGIGPSSDISANAIALAEATLKEVDPSQSDLVMAASVAVDLARRDPASSVTKCRVILEAMVKEEWCRRSNASAPPKWKSVHDLAQELDAMPDVDRDILNTQRTLYRLSNLGAHTIDGVTPRRAALVLLLTVTVLARRL